jgi:HAD superfamily hydrolase (TIGR01490 family)
MDRTLVDIHTGRLYLKYQRDIGEVSWVDALRASYWLFEYSVGIANADRIAQRVLRDYRGKPASWLAERFQNWFKHYVLPCVSAIGRERVGQHQAQGQVMAVATSAIRFAAEPLARELGIQHLVCSELEVAEGNLTGQFAPPLCYGPGKRERSEALLRSLGFTFKQAAFYTDSITDLPLLEVVGYPVVVNPDSRLRRVALRRGWPIEGWMADPRDRLPRSAPAATATDDTPEASAGAPKASKGAPSGESADHP